MEELGRDALGGEKRPRLVAALTLIFAKERKDEFNAWAEGKKKDPAKGKPVFRVLTVSSLRKLNPPS